MSRYHYTWNLKKIIQMNLIYKIETDSLTENKLMVTKGETWQGGINQEVEINKYTLLYIKDLLYVYIYMLCYAKSLQSCPTLCDPIDSSLPGSPVPGILQTRTLEWVAISFSNAWKWKVKVKSLSPVRLFATPWTAAHQAPLSMGFSRQEYCSGVPLPSLVYIYKDLLYSTENSNQYM